MAPFTQRKIGCWHPHRSGMRSRLRFGDSTAVIGAHARRKHTELLPWPNSCSPFLEGQPQPRRYKHEGAREIRRSILISDSIWRDLRREAFSESEVKGGAAEGAVELFTGTLVMRCRDFMLMIVLFGGD